MTQITKITLNGLNATGAGVPATDMREDQYIIEYIDGGDCCADCCGKVEALAADHSIVTGEQRQRIDSAVGGCEYRCDPRQSHRYFDRRGKEVM